MKQIIKKWVITAALVSAIFGISISAQAGYGFQKVAYHVNYDDAKRQAGALRNIQNHINAVGAKNMDIRVVMHGKGLSYYYCLKKRKILNYRKVMRQMQCKLKLLD